MMFMIITDDQPLLLIGINEIPRLCEQIFQEIQQTMHGDGKQRISLLMEQMEFLAFLQKPALRMLWYCSV